MISLSRLALRKPMRERPLCATLGHSSRCPFDPKAERPLKLHLDTLPSVIPTAEENYHGIL